MPQLYRLLGMQTALAVLFVASMMVINAVAMERKASWYMNNYQVKAYIKSVGYNGLRLYTYAIYGAIAFFAYMAWQG